MIRIEKFKQIEKSIGRSIISGENLRKAQKESKIGGEIVKKCVYVSEAKLFF